MNFLKSRRFYVSLIIAIIISLFLVLPMILGMMGYDVFNRRPSSMPDIPFWGAFRRILYQWLVYFVIIFVLLLINTYRSERYRKWHRIVSNIAAALVFLLFLSLVPPVPFSPAPPQGGPEREGIHRGDREGLPPEPDNGRADGTFRAMTPDPRRLSEFVFIIVTAVLIGKVLELVEQKQQMKLENEHLRAENLQTRYDILINQINPHFFFNSLNSLSALVRDGRNDNAIKYIGELSNTYRYVMQSPGRELVTVAEELESVAAYSYLLQIRYEDKLFFRTEVDDAAMTMLLPVLTLQPLVENAVKHNVISAAEPFTVTISGDTTKIRVSNPVRPRQDNPESNGIGLKNLANRYRLLTGRDIETENGGGYFVVTLPLVKPSEA